MDLLFSGNAQTASLHLKHLKEDCLDYIISTNEEGKNIIRDERIVTENIRQPSSDARRGRGVSLSSLSESTPTNAGGVVRIADSLCLNDCTGRGRCDSGNQIKY